MSINISELNGYILCYNSKNRFKVHFNKDNNIANLYYLNKDIMWEKLDSFEYTNMSDNEIINKSKELINIWKGEPVNNIHHITKLD